MATMTTETLQQIGPALFGKQWVADLSRALDVTPHYVSDWIAYRRPIPPHRVEQIYALCEQRGLSLLALLPDAQRAACMQRLRKGSNEN